MPCRACLASQILDAQRGKAAAEAELKRTQAALERTLGQSRALEAEHKHALAALDADAWKRTVATVGPDDFVRTAHRFYAGRVSPKVLPLLTAVASALGPLAPAKGEGEPITSDRGADRACAQRAALPHPHPVRRPQARFASRAGACQPLGTSEAAAAGTEGRS